MPKYGYACIQCDLDYEKERSIHSAEPNYVCDKCGYALQRVFTPFGLQFKGSGFYKTGGQLQSGLLSLAGTASGAIVIAAPDWFAST